MIPGSNLMSGVAVGLFALISLSGCDARQSQDMVPSSTAPSVAPAGSPASTGMAGIDHGAMPGMDHGAMSGMAPSPGAAAPGAMSDHSSMAGMDHSGMAGMSPVAGSSASSGAMDHSAMAGMDHSARAGMVAAHQSAGPSGAMDHSAMSGMDHSGMEGTTAAPQTAAAPGAMDHSAMAGMDHSAMAGMAGMSPPPRTGTALAASSPVNGAMVQGSPGTVSLTLPQRMTLQSVSLSNAVGQRIPLSATLPDGPVETFVTPVPPLPAGTYTVAWTAATGSQTVNGTFGFMVH